MAPRPGGSCVLFWKIQARSQSSWNIWVLWLKKMKTQFCYSQLFNHNLWFTKPNHAGLLLLKFMFSRKATKIDKIFTVNLTLCKGQLISKGLFAIFTWTNKWTKYFCNSALKKIVGSSPHQGNIFSL